MTGRMNDMKKWLAFVLALCLPVAALAASPTVTANGVVESENVVKITAPWSGVLLPFDWKNGDRAETDDVLFTMDTFKIYAPANGRVGALFAEPGDLAADVMAQYGMLLSIEKDAMMIINATTSGAYNDEDNRIIHMGEKVYFEQSSDRDNKGEGRVISVGDKQYVVELTKGDFETDDSVKIYREDTMSSKSCIGSGKVARQAELAVTGAGRVLRCAVTEGERVKKGDLLLELVSQDAENNLISADITAGQAGALELSAMPGQQVYKGMVLAQIHDLSRMNVVAEVDEMDLDLIRVGDSLTVVLDRYPDAELAGVVQEIASIGIPRQNATYYHVTLALTTGLEVLPGMNATVWLAMQK